MRKKILISLIVLTGLVFGGSITYSMYTSSTSLVSTNELASFVFESKKTDVIDLELSDLVPGDVLEYNFSVTNSNNLDSSDVLIDYFLTIKTFRYIPLNIEVYMVNDSTEVLMFDCSDSIKNSNGEFECKSEVNSLNFGIDEVDDYKIKVSFMDGYNDWSYADLVDFISLEINASQRI